MSNDFHAVKALRRGECGPTGGVGGQQELQRGLRIAPHEEYAATVRRAFAPFASSLIVLGCAEPGSSLAARPVSRPELAPLEPSSAADAPPGWSRTFAERVGEFTLDRLAPPLLYGEQGEPLERACERVLGPGCRSDEHAWLERVETLRYLSDSSRTRSVEGVLSRFNDLASAYAHFTRLLVGDADPTELDATALDDGSLVRLGSSLLGWRGREVLLLTLVDEDLPPDRREASAAQTLPELARAVLSKRGEAMAAPAAVQRLPDAERIALGVRFLLADAFGVAGLGPSARGYYQAGEKRWRVLAIARPDAESAEDVMQSLRRRPDAHPLANAPLEALELTERRLPGEPQLGWLIARRGDVVLGIGDEAHVLPEFMPAAAEAMVKLSRQEKLAKLLGARQR